MTAFTSVRRTAPGRAHHHCWRPAGHATRRRTTPSPAASAPPRSRVSERVCPGRAGPQRPRHLHRQGGDTLWGISGMYLKRPLALA